MSTPLSTHKKRCRHPKKEMSTPNVDTAIKCLQHGKFSFAHHPLEDIPT